MRVFGRIEDAYTEQLLAGALITLRVGDTKLIAHTPAKEGNFDYEIPDETIPIDEEVLTCIVEKQGYRTQITTYTITDEIELAIELVPILVNWKRIFIVSGIILGSLLLLVLITFAIKYFFFGPKEYPIKTFTVKPAKIKAGDQAEIKWETVDADVVFLGSEKVEESDQVEPTGAQTVSPTQTRKYFLTVRDDDGEQVARQWLELKVIPPPPVILSFIAKPLEINLWESAVLEWKTMGAEEIFIISDPENKTLPIDVQKIHRDQAIIDREPAEEDLESPENKKELNGAIEVFPLETTTFTLAAVNSQGVKREESVEVKVLVAPQVLSFTANAGTIDPGESVVLNWDTREAEQVFLNGERTAPRFSLEVRPDGTTTYTLTARNKVGERHCKLTVTVRCPELPELAEPLPLKPPRIHRFHVSAPVIAPGESTVLTWVTDYAEKVYLTSKPVELDMPSAETIAITGENVEDTGTGTAAAKKMEIIAGKPLETGQVIRVKPVDSLQVSPRVSTRYQLLAINPLKEVSWTRTVEVKSTICTVILYELENYRGDYMYITADAAEIGEMNNRVSSIKIIGNCGVKVFSASNFTATHQEFFSSVPRLRGTWIGNNTISSLKLISHPGAEK
jgi:hypothetical protein